MIGNLMALSVRNRWGIVALVLIVAGLGLWQLLKLPIDAVPDITNVQVQINTVDPGLAPIDMEKRVSFPVETALAGIPGLESTRSLSRNGFSQVTAVFEEGTDLYFARQQVSERLAQARDSLPDGVQPQIGPVTTGLGEVLMYTVDFTHPGGKGAPRVDGKPGWQTDGSYLTPEGDRLADDVSRAAYLRTVQDWIIRPQLRTVQGVAGIDSIGGYEKQYVVEPDPARLIAYGVSFSELGEALEAANLSVGANFFNRGGEAYLVRADARIRTLDEIGDAVIATRGGVPVKVRDVANVRIGGDLRTGAASMNGHEVVIGTALMLIGENGRIVAGGVSDKLAQTAKSLPPGIAVETVLNRSELVGATVATVQKNLIEGAILTAIALFLLLGNFRAAFIAVLVIPLSFLMMAAGMNAFGVPGNLMSLGALDFGLIVDGSVVILENCLRRLAERQHREGGRLLSLRERLEETTLGAQEMIKPTVFGQAIIFLVFVPLLMFSGVEGKTFSPMAITIMLALAAAFILSITMIPALVALVVTGEVAEKEVRGIVWLKRVYAPVLDRTVARPWPFIMGGLAVFAVAGALFTTLGREFIPTLDERNLALNAFRVPSTSLEQSIKMQRGVEAKVATLPEVRLMFAKTGTAEVATDPMPANYTDGFVMLKPKEEWPAGLTKADVIRRVEVRANTQLGNSFEITQPIQTRFNELIGGVRGDVAIKLYGEDLDKLTVTAGQIASVLRATPGAADVRAEQTAGSPTLDVRFDRAAIARYGLTVEEVADTVAAAMGGRVSGLVFEGDRRFDVVVRVPAAARASLDDLGALPVMLPEDGDIRRSSIPLSSVAQFRFSEGLNQISRENGSRRVVIQANVRGRDIGSFVADAKPKVEAVPLPPGSHLEWGGQFESLNAATARLSIVVPICFAAIFVLLYLALGNLRRALAVFTAVPLGITGGVFTLAATGIPFSVSAAVGFLCLLGVAVLNSLIVMTAIGQRIDGGMEIGRAIVEGLMEKVRPVLMTGLVPAVGFIPMAIATGTGAEVQKPLAIVVIGGLVVATFLTLLVLPAISRVMLGGKRAETASDFDPRLMPAE